MDEWWNKFDLIEKILIKDAIIYLCSGETSPIKKKKYMDAIRKILEEKKELRRRIRNE